MKRSELPWSQGDEDDRREEIRATRGNDTWYPKRPFGAPRDPREWSKFWCEDMQKVGRGWSYADPARPCPPDWPGRLPLLLNYPADSIDAVERATGPRGGIGPPPPPAEYQVFGPWFLEHLETRHVEREPAPLTDGPVRLCRPVLHDAPPPKMHARPSRVPMRRPWGGWPVLTSDGQIPELFGPLTSGYGTRRQPHGLLLFALDDDDDDTAGPELWSATEDDCCRSWPELRIEATREGKGSTRLVDISAREGPAQPHAKVPLVTGTIYRAGRPAFYAVDGMAGYAWGGDQLFAAHALRETFHERAQRLLDYVVNHPGCLRAEAVEGTGIDSDHINEAMRTLERAGAVLYVRDQLTNRENRIFLCAGVRLFAAQIWGVREDDTEDFLGARLAVLVNQPKGVSMPTVNDKHAVTVRLPAPVYRAFRKVVQMTDRTQDETALEAIAIYIRGELDALKSNLPPSAP